MDPEARKTWCSGLSACPRRSWPFVQKVVQHFERLDPSADAGPVESSALPLGAADNLPPADVRSDVLGRRLIAALLDLTVLVALFGVIAALTGGFHSQTVTNGMSKSMPLQPS